jgi:hypothetical protein
MSDAQHDDIFAKMRSISSKLNKDSNPPADKTSKQLSIFDAMRSAARNVDVKAVEDESEHVNKGVDVDTILDSHYTVDRHTIDKKICQSCAHWIKPCCCALTADRAYGVTSYKVTAWSHTCARWAKIILRSFPESKPKEKRRNSYTAYKHKR